MLEEDILAKFIRENKEKFDVYRPPDNHLEKFLLKITFRIRHIVSIVPYLIRVAVVAAIIFLSSVIVWNNYIRQDRHEITLKNKILLVVNKIPTNQYNK